MSDILTELMNSGSVDTETLAKLLREQERVGLAGELSGSKRLGPTGQDLRAGARETAAGIGAVRTEDALSRMKEAMRLAAKRAELEAKGMEGDLNRQNRLDVAGLRNRGMLDAIAARKKGSQTSGDDQLMAFETQADHLDDLANVAVEARKMTSPWTTGYGSALKAIPGTDASSLEEFLVPLRSEEALSKLGELREMAAAMGQKGSGLGQVTEREIGLLMGARRSLETAQNEGQIDRALRHLEQAHRTAAKNIRREIQKIKASGGIGMVDRPGTQEESLADILAAAGINEADIAEDDDY